MHVAVAIGALVLGGWVLNTSTDTGSDEASLRLQLQQAQQSNLDAQRTERPRRPSKADAANQGYSEGQGQNYSSQDILPYSPTADLSGEGGGEIAHPVAPTSEGAGEVMSGSGGVKRPFGRRPLMAPTGTSRSSSSKEAFRPTSRSSLGQKRSPSGDVMMQQMPTGTASFMTPPGTPMTTGSTEKAFSGFRPQSGVSPYMNLFRRDNGGTVDNYTTLVRPQLEQRYLNQQFGQDIGGLEQNARIQQMNMQRMNQQQPRQLQGIGTPQYYMNSGESYQGYGQ